MSSAGSEGVLADAEGSLERTTSSVRWVKGCSSSLGRCHCLGNFDMSSCHNHQVLVEVKASLDDGFEVGIENLRSWRRTGSHHEPDVTAVADSPDAVAGLGPEGGDRLMIDEMLDLGDPKRGHSMTPYR